MSNEIQLYEGLSKDSNALERLGMVLGKSGTVAFNKAEAGVMMLAICVTEKITPLQFMRTFHVMPNGTLSLKAGAALAKFEEMGGKFEWMESGDGACSKEDERKATAKFISKSGRTVTYTYSIADARREQLLKKDSRWDKRPGSMLRARVITNALGMIEPSIFFGELDDYEVPPGADLDLGKAEPAKPAAASASPGKVIDIQVVPVAASVKPGATASVAPQASTSAATSPDTEKELAAGLAPAQPFQPAVYADGEHKGKLTIETVKAFYRLVGLDKAEAVLANLQAAGWFKDGRVEEISLSRMQRVFSDVKGFMSKFGPK